MMDECLWPTKGEDSEMSYLSLQSYILFPSKLAWGFYVFVIKVLKNDQDDVQ